MDFQYHADNLMKSLYEVRHEKEKAEKEIRYYLEQYHIPEYNYKFIPLKRLPKMDRQDRWWLLYYIDRYIKLAETDKTMTNELYRWKLSEEYAKRESEFAAEYESFWKNFGQYELPWVEYEQNRRGISYQKAYDILYNGKEGGRI